MKAVIIFFFLFSSMCLIAQMQPDTTTWNKNLDQVVITAQFTPTDTRETVNSV